MIAALYVLARGPYADMEGVDPWPEKRNALLYRGPYSVVTHAPCGPHSRSVAHQTHLSVTQGPWLAPCAILQVRKYGGIFEHPARSMLWEKMSLPYPDGYHPRAVAPPLIDAFGGFTVATDQRRFGHEALKKTWLYMVGIRREDVHLPEPIERPANSTVRRVDKRTGRSWYRGIHELGSPENRKRTPPAFARWLVDLAETSTGGRTP